MIEQFEQGRGSGHLVFRPAGQKAEPVADRFVINDGHQISDDAEDHSPHNIQDRMLLDKEGRHADQRAQDRHDKAAPAAEAFAVPGGKHCRQRTQDVNGRADVGIGIKGIQSLDDMGQDVVPGENGRSQILAGRINQVNDHRDPVGKDNETHHLFEGLHIIEKQEDDRTDQIDEPEVIRDHKNLVKRDQCIHGAADRVINTGHGQALDRREKDAENGPEKQHPQIAVLRLQKAFGPKVPKIKFQIIFPTEFHR